MINVTKTFLPPMDEYTELLKRAWDRQWVTNHGPLLQELEAGLKAYLGVNNLLVCCNGTIALQMALKALELTGEVITTPFSYVATTTAIIWENCSPVFVDIDPRNFCIDPAKIVAAITDRTQAILATHVYGHPCDIEAIEKIAQTYRLKVIYDGAHAFGTTYRGQSVFNYGDVSACSFHATKVFHMAEGGCLITNNPPLYRQLELYRSFGHVGEDYFTPGINAKSSELHAALGLCNLKYIGDILARQKVKWLYYQEALQGSALQLLEPGSGMGYNYAYFPVVFPSANALIRKLDQMNKLGIFPRRYFFPALNTLKYVNYQPCEVAEDLSERVACLPLYDGLSLGDQQRVIRALLK